MISGMMMMTMIVMKMKRMSVMMIMMMITMMTVLYSDDHNNVCDDDGSCGVYNNGNITLNNVIFNMSCCHGFPGTNPEKLRLRLLNSKPNQSVRVAIWYSKPQRLDIYCQGQFIYPTNADIKASGYTLKKKDPSLPSDQFEPALTSISGSNYFDSESRLLYVVVRGGLPVDIRTMPIIQLTIGKGGRVSQYSTSYSI